eukprot:CAMPEP_0175279296 /NCGR_PEP_ID=MMETSP0093-20121207/49968_1 /TAXON_ID=311494 /ORGANISM="Alexandrium monilatum, Strain CCMP3105" /LENGTH=48 /DNA_ID= /DNA_START= /DNA_END= /DNA_ORIENTATION=
MCGLVVGLRADPRIRSALELRGAESHPGFARHLSGRGGDNWGPHPQTW